MDLMIKLLKSLKPEPWWLKIIMEMLSSLTMLKKVMSGECAKLNKILLEIGLNLLLREPELQVPQLFSG